MPEQIVVPASPLIDQLWALARQVMPPLATYAIGRGYVAADQVAMAGAVAVAVVPIIIGQIKTRTQAQKLATLANVVPDAVAVAR